MSAFQVTANFPAFQRMAASGLQQTVEENTPGVGFGSTAYGRFLKSRHSLSTSQIFIAEPASVRFGDLLKSGMTSGNVSNALEPDVRSVFLLT